MDQQDQEEAAEAAETGNTRGRADKGESKHPKRRGQDHQTGCGASNHEDTDRGPEDPQTAAKRRQATQTPTSSKTTQKRGQEGRKERGNERKEGKKGGNDEATNKEQQEPNRN